jgi:hypothetical protein
MSRLWKLTFYLFGISLLWVGPCIAATMNSPHQQVEYYSQASQDRFAYLILYELLGKQDVGYYLEIGAGHPYNGNNTYLFEKNQNWKGVSIDISDEFKHVWTATRQNPLLIEDATQSNYRSILAPFPRVIDYLSLDIDSSYDIVLQNLLSNDYIFKVITIEHDFYRYGDKFRKGEREILSSLGYYLLCPDVSVFFNGSDCVFEDWWVHPSAFSPEVFFKLQSLDLKAKSHEQLINSLRNHYEMEKTQY